MRLVLHAACVLPGIRPGPCGCHAVRRGAPLFRICRSSATRGSVRSKATPVENKEHIEHIEHIEYAEYAEYDNYLIKK